MRAENVSKPYAVLNFKKFLNTNINVKDKAKIKVKIINK